MWRLFKKKTPKNKGWYLCTIEIKNFQRYTMPLYWYPSKKRFIDNIRKNVCETYIVKDCKNKRIFDIGQDRTDEVIAWRKMPKTYMKGFLKD